MLCVAESTDESSSEDEIQNKAKLCMANDAILRQFVSDTEESDF